MRTRWPFRSRFDGVGCACRGERKPGRGHVDGPLDSPWNITCSVRRRRDRVETPQPSFGTPSRSNSRLKGGRRAESRPFRVVQPPLGTYHVPSAWEGASEDGPQIGWLRTRPRITRDRGAHDVRMPGDTQEGAAGQELRVSRPVGRPPGLPARFAGRELRVMHPAGRGGVTPGSPSAGVRRPVRRAPGRSTRHSGRPPALRAALAPP
jgi:hypothetical protein